MFPFPTTLLYRYSLLLCLLLPVSIQAQDLLDRKLEFECRDCKPGQALVNLSRASGINIVFSERFFADCPRLDLPRSEEKMAIWLDRICACSKLSYREVGGQIALFRRLQRYSFSGFVVDEETGERIIGASLRVLNDRTMGVISNEFGYFSLTLEEGDYTFFITAVGFQPKRLELPLNGNRKIQIALSHSAPLPEVVISGTVPDSSQRSKFREDRNGLPLSQLNTIPMPGGEADLLRLAALQPGVQTGVDGLGGLHIRGGNADQNLILLDDLPVYNPSHALGLFSIFSPATVSNAKLWKGDFPARYGGRMASVLDVRTREGNFREFHSSAAVGLFAASFTVEGPLKPDTSSFIASGRFTYFQPWIHFFSQRDNLITFTGDRVLYRYNDFNLKWNYTFSQRHRLYVTLYNGGDTFGDSFDQRYANPEGLLTDRYTLGSSWGNRIAAIRWNQTYGNRLFSNTTLRYSRFFYQSQLSFNSTFYYPNGKQSVLSDFGQLYQTRIRDWSGKTDFTFFPSSKLTMRWGASYTLHDFRPGALSANFLLPGQSAAALDSLANLLLNNEKLSADELEAYLDAEWRPWQYWKIEMGLNASVFQIRQVNYPILLPRFKAGWYGRRGWNLWGSFTGAAQNLHQIGSFNISLPFELWVPSTAKVPPERGWQTALGLGHDGRQWQWQVEAYYKQQNRVLSFLSANDALYTGGAEDASGWEDRIAVGTGYSKGLEASIAWSYGSGNVTTAYTLSKSIRQFPDLNSGNPFPFRFDRRHDFKINVHQRILPWLYADLGWYFATGNPITLTGVKFTHHVPEGDIRRDVYAYTAINGYRLPAYHRLDASIEAMWGSGKGRHSVQFGAYNVYNRNNPFFLFLDTGSGVSGKAIQYTLLPLLPIFRYELKF
ncbi:MAG: carboxypeptidase-like regulatory domain-containing protein [Lewinellaceae bacterium]|nr:carboxypeptidase-like regulatory domain-containing protein [Lewinellaceae bacterium]